MALLTEEQAAQELGVPASRLSNWRWAGKGPAFVALSRKCVRYDLAELRRFIAEHTRQPSVQTFMEERRAAL